MRGSRRGIFDGLFLRFLTHTNLVVTALTAFAVLYTRSVGVAYFSAGALACTVSVKILKLVLQQARPVQTTHYKQKQSYGYVAEARGPSSMHSTPHTQDAQHAFCDYHLLRDLHHHGLCMATVASDAPRKLIIPPLRDTGGSSVGVRGSWLVLLLRACGFSSGLMGLVHWVR